MAWSVLDSASIRENLRFRSAFWLSVRPSLILSNQRSITAPDDLLLDKPSLVEQRHDGTVGDRLVDGVAVDQPPKVDSVFFSFFSSGVPVKPR